MQDWKPIQFSKTHRRVQPNNPPNAVRLEDETEKLKHALVSSDVKIAIMQGRQTKQLSQLQVANALNVSVQIIKGYENGSAIPDNAFIARLERFLGVKLPRQKK